MAAADICPPPMSTTPPPVPPPIEDLSKVHIKLPTCLEELEKEWFEVDLKSATSTDIHEIDWNKAIGFTVSSEGSEGVIFVQFEDKSVVTIKGSSTEAADMFAMNIATLADIAIPDFRILKLGVDDEYKVLHDKLNELDENNNPLKRGKHSKAMEKPVISVIEFIKGKNLYELDPHDIFGKDSINARGANFCKALARITAYDVVINNWDRIPIIWDNKGNPENVLFTTSRKRKEISPFAIDNTITSIDPSLEENFSEYMDKVRYLINEICQTWKEVPVFKNVRETFTITCFTKQPSVTNLREFFGDVFLGNYDIGEAGMRYFTIGFVEKILEFAKVTKEDLEKVMEDLKKQVEKPLELANMMPESIAMQKINLDFVNSILEIFREATPILTKIQVKMEAVGNPTN